MHTAKMFRMSYKLAERRAVFINYILFYSFSVGRIKMDEWWRLSAVDTHTHIAHQMRKFIECDRGVMVFVCQFQKLFAIHLTRK